MSSLLQNVLSWVTAFMVSYAPPGESPWGKFIPEARETQEESAQRYESIAKDLIDVVFDAEEKPLFKDAQGRFKTIAVLEGIAFYESAFRRDVDYGLGSRARGDHGRSVCMWQIMMDRGHAPKWNEAKKRFAWTDDSPSQVEEGYTADEIQHDRKKCIRTALRKVRESFVSCPRDHLPVDQLLRVYASGNCSDEGASKSRLRMNAATNWFNAHKPTFSDQEVLADLHPQKDTLGMVDFFDLSKENRLLTSP